MFTMDILLLTVESVADFNYLTKLFNLIKFSKELCLMEKIKLICEL